jgi:hypothetical protein
MLTLAQETLPILQEYVEPYQDTVYKSESNDINSIIDKLSRGETVDIGGAPETPPQERKKKSKKEDNNPLGVLGDIHTISEANLESENDDE